jgi:glycine cleavage system H protein
MPNIPGDLRYSKEHEWLRVEGDTGTIGITDYAQDQLGDIVYLDLPAAGGAVTQFEKMGEIESVKAVSDLYTPIGGEVLEVNSEAVEDPELVNKEPYGRGWLIKVRLADAAELDGLLSPEGYEEVLAAEEAEA